MEILWYLLFQLLQWMNDILVILEPTVYKMGDSYYILYIFIKMLFINDQILLMLGRGKDSIDVLQVTTVD